MRYQKLEKWTSDQIETSIDVYQEELGLYATYIVSDYNKRLRAN